MNLTLTLSNPEILPETLRTSRVEFGGAGGIIGRHQDCDWVLDDPERFVSSRHVRVSSRGDTFYIEDTSTNGTFLNDELIGKGNKKTLSTGDTLRLGRYILSVEHRDGQGNIVNEQSVEDPFNITERASTTGGLLDDAGATNEIDTFIAEGPADPVLTPPPGDDLLGAVPMAAVQDAMPVMRQAETNEAIPEDWMDRSDAADVPSPLPEPEPVVSEPRPEPKPEPQPEPIAAPVAPEPVKAAPVPPVAPPPPPPPPIVAPPPPPAPEVKAVPVPPIRHAGHNQTGADSAVPDDFNTAMLHAVGLHTDYATPENGQMLGMVTREMLSGMLSLIEARNRMRQEMRLDGTIIGARENNPLKFSINYQDAVTRMLQGEDMGFMPPVQATQQVVRDLRGHQIAMLAGIDAGIKALLGAMDPKTVTSGKTYLAGAQAINKMSEHHAKVTEDTERSDGVFWYAFKTAYELSIANTRGQAVGQPGR